MKEIWRDIKGYEDKYQISSIGRVKSLKYNNTNKKKILKLYDVFGYLRVSLGRNNQLSVHRLVAENFIFKPQNKTQINHINCIKKDNRVENLEWVTISENQNYAFWNYLKNIPCSEDHWNCKLTSCEVIEIRNFYKKNKITTRQLAKKYNISQTQICNIINNKQRNYEDILQ